MNKKKNEKKYYIDKKIIVACCMFAVVAILVFMLVSYTGSTNDNAIVAKISGQPIALGEFKLFFTHHRSDTFTYFYNKYGTEDSKDFWTTDFGGEIPIQVAKQRTIEELKKIKVEQILMKEKGIVTDISYKKFFNDFIKENKRREEAVKKNEVIYGPTQYQEKTYYDYLHTNRVIKLKEVLWENKFAITDEDLKVYYASPKHKEPSYRNQDYIKVQMISIPWSEKKKERGLTESEAKNKIEAAQKMLNNEAGFEQVMKAYNKVGLEDERVFDESTYRNDSKYDFMLFEPVSNLEENEVSSIIEYKSLFCIVKCVERKDGEYKPFDEVKEFVKSKYNNEKYEELVNNLLSQAKVEINESVYDSIKVR